MAMAPVVYTLWQDYLRFDPEDPIWPNRDRFILSAGHASTLLYALLHLAGVKAVNRKYEDLGELPVSIEDLKSSGKRSVTAGRRTLSSWFHRRCLKTSRPNSDSGARNYAATG